MTLKLTIIVKVAKIRSISTPKDSENCRTTTKAHKVMDKSLFPKLQQTSVFLDTYYIVKNDRIRSIYIFRSQKSTKNVNPPPKMSAQ